MQIAGDFGTFFTDPTSPVFFLNTSFEIDSIKYLKPVREVLDVAEVDFDELVQRDLDDFRIRQDIVPYLVDNMGYKFFPPIVVALTQPAANRQSIKQYYPPIKAKLIENGRKLEVEFDNAFSLTWYTNGSDQVHSLPAALRWNPDKTHLMAVDGQHRLVALQAVRGLLVADNLKLFYHNVLQYKDELDNIKVPVTILIFPNCIQNIAAEDLALLQRYFVKIDWATTSRMPVKQVLRDIFVDVNKSARQPSKARTILLNEKDLSAIFSRRIFSSIKDENPTIYSALLEYNSTTNKDTQIEKGRAIITTIGIVYNICQFLFADEKGVGIDDGTTLRTRLDILNYPEFPSSEEFPKETMKSTEFSLEQRKIAQKIFAEKWLHVFKSFLIDLLPFKILTDAMKAEYDKYQLLLKDLTISADDNEIYKILFGNVEDRFILENNAKIRTNTQVIIKLRKLKELESRIRGSVSNHEVFYTLMFQRGFFEAVTKLIEDGLFENSYYVKHEELGYIIATLNLYISNHPKGSLFEYSNPINNLIFGGKASPENSNLIAALITVILVNYKRSSLQNLLLKNIEVAEGVRARLSVTNLIILKEKMKRSLAAEYKSLTANKIRLSEIQLKKEQDDNDWKAMQLQFEADMEYYVAEHLTQEEIKLKKDVEIED